MLISIGGEWWMVKKKGNNKIIPTTRFVWLMGQSCSKVNLKRNYIRKNLRTFPQNCIRKTARMVPQNCSWNPHHLDIGENLLQTFKPIWLMITCIGRIPSVRLFKRVFFNPAIFVNTFQRLHQFDKLLYQSSFSLYHPR